MSNSTYSALSAITKLAGTEFWGVGDGTAISKKIVASALAAYAGQSLFGQQSAYLGLKGDGSTDNTALFNSLFSSLPVGAGIILAPGTYCYSGPLTNKNGISLIGIAGRENTTMLSTSSTGKGCFMDINSGSTSTLIDSVVIRDITWQTLNTPPSPTNNGAEQDGAIRVNGQVGNEYKNVNVLSCDFINIYGPCVLFRCLHDGMMGWNRLFGNWKDGLHITGTSASVARFYNRIENGGDDALPVVGYATGATIGQPDGILDVGNMVRGVKAARAFVYVGARNVVNVDSVVDGAIPPEYGVTGYLTTGAGLLIGTDSSSGTYGCQNIHVSNMNIKNCGKIDPPYNGTYGAVQMAGSTSTATNMPTTNVKLHNITVVSSAWRGMQISGNAAGGITGLSMRGVHIYDTTDPNNINGNGAGVGVNTGIALYDVRDFLIEDFYIGKTGSQSIYVDSSCTGRGRIWSGRVENWNASTSSQSNIDGINIASGIGTTSLEIGDISCDTQSAAARDVVYCNNPGRVSWGEIHSSVNYGLYNGGTATSASTGSWPITVNNTQSYPIVVNVTGTTSGVTSITRTCPGGPSAAPTNKTAGTFLLPPSAILTINGSGTAPSVSWFAQQV